MVSLGVDDGEVYLGVGGGARQATANQRVAGSAPRRLRAPRLFFPEASALAGFCAAPTALVVYRMVVQARVGHECSGWVCNFALKISDEKKNARLMGGIVPSIAFEHDMPCACCRGFGGRARWARAALRAAPTVIGWCGVGD
jgi:hypothetical protein